MTHLRRHMRAAKAAFDDLSTIQLAREVAGAVTLWRESAASVGIRRQEIDRMATAFEHEDLDIARRL